MATIEGFRRELFEQIGRAASQDRPHIEVNAGELHRAVGGYPPASGENHSMPSCCAALRAAMVSGDEIVYETPSGNSASLTIRYMLPRPIKIERSHFEVMRQRYRPDVAVRLAQLADERRTITYSELTEEFGRGPRLWGDPLGGIAIRCFEAGLPLLSVLVVNASNGLPSVDAVLYRDLGVQGDEAAKAEQRRCFEFDWSSTLLSA
jgi:5-methylcytosine-specific restriction protein A